MVWVVVSGLGPKGPRTQIVLTLARKNPYEVVVYIYIYVGFYYGDTSNINHTPYRDDLK